MARNAVNNVDRFNTMARLRDSRDAKAWMKDFDTSLLESLTAEQAELFFELQEMFSRKGDPPETVREYLTGFTDGLEMYVKQRTQEEIQETEDKKDSSWSAEAADQEYMAGYTDGLELLQMLGEVGKRKREEGEGPAGRL